MIRQLTYDDKDAIIEVMDTRDKLMLSESSSTNNTYAVIENKENFEANLCYGYFDGDTLNAFTYVNVWRELPAFSVLTYTRAGVDFPRNELNTNIALADLWLYVRKELCAKGITEHYQVTAAKGWADIKTQVKPTSIVDVVEVIPAGAVSRYPLFRARLLNRRLEHNVKITRYTILPECRNGEVLND